jgi:hypothetical protein
MDQLFFDKHKNHNWGKLYSFIAVLKERGGGGAWMITHNGAEEMVKVDKVIYLPICHLPVWLLGLLVIGATVVEAAIHSQGTSQRLLTATAKCQNITCITN